MKKFLLSLLATVALVGCGSKDDNEPTPPQRPDFTKEQQNYLPTKKVKHVTASYVEADYENGSYPSVQYKDFLKPELNQRQKFTVKTMEYFYEYDSAGRITKVTFKREGSSDIVSTLAYSDISVTITAPPPYDGIREPQSIEYGLNSSGNILSIGIYNEKQQLKNSVYAGAFTWENDNLTKMSRKVTRNGVVKERGLKFSYNSATNKNKFYLLNAIGDDIRSYQEYFALSIAVIKGAAPKNLPTEVSPLEGSDPYSSRFERPVSFSYTFDGDEFVKTIAEKENKFVPGSLYSYVPNNGNNEIATYWSELPTLIANIENKTVTDKSYKLISDDGSTRIFEITVPVKVEKDSNGKTINLNVNKVCKFTVSYNNTSATNISMEATYNADMITNYELNY